VIQGGSVLLLLSMFLAYLWRRRSTSVSRTGDRPAPPPADADRRSS